MKSFLILITVLFAMTAMANTVDSVYKKDSGLPYSLKQEILEQIADRCPGTVSEFSLKEINTEVEEHFIDQGVVDYFFTTTFMSYYYFDGSHPIKIYITVKSAEYGFQNGDNTDIFSFKSDYGCDQK